MVCNLVPTRVLLCIQSWKIWKDCEWCHSDIWCHKSGKSRLLIHESVSTLPPSDDRKAHIYKLSLPTTWIVNQCSLRYRHLRDRILIASAFASSEWMNADLPHSSFFHLVLVFRFHFLSVNINMNVWTLDRIAGLHPVLVSLLCTLDWLSLR